MRCHFSEKDEETSCDASGLNIWTSSTVQNPSVLKSVDSMNDIEAKSFPDDLSTLYSLDSVSQSYKRKILECEREEFEERFSKIQRKRLMLRETAKANLVVDEDEDFEDDEIYEQMEWIQGKSNAMTLHLWKDKDVDLSFQSISSSTPIMYIPKLNWREERRHLLRISMAKIRGVDDPETYLRRSVLINNTVKRLQKDVANNYRYNTVASSSIFQESFAIANESDNWKVENSNNINIGKDQSKESSEFQYTKSVGDSDCTSFIYSNSNPQTSIPYNFQLSLLGPLSSDKPIDTFQNEILQRSAIFARSSQDDQIVYDQCRTLKQSSPVHVFSSQPCGLQYRNTTHEDTCNEYNESTNSSSILDSVVYHSLIASLET